MNTWTSNKPALKTQTHKHTLLIDKEFKTMSNQVIARKIVSVGHFNLEVFLLEDGNHYLSQKQVAQVVGRDMASTWQYQAARPAHVEYPQELRTLVGELENGELIDLFSMTMATFFWIEQAIQGNVAAKMLLNLTAIKTIEQRADQAFGIEKAQAEYDSLYTASPNFDEIYDSLFEASEEILPKEEILDEIPF